MFETYPDVINPEDLQEILHLGRTTIYSMLKAGTIPNRRIGGKYFVRKQDVANFLPQQHN